MNSEQQLMDALLKEQARKREADEALLSQIEQALDRQASKGTSAWRRALPLSIAAALALSTAAIYWKNHEISIDLAMNDQTSENSPTRLITASPMAAPERDREGRASEGERSDLSLREFSSQPVDSVEESKEPAMLSVPQIAETKHASVSSAAPIVKSEKAAIIGGLPLADQISLDKGRVGRAPAPESGAMVESKKTKVSEGGGGGRLLRGMVSSDHVERQQRSKILSSERYGPLVDQAWKSPWDDALSTFSIDVDTASYTNLRRMIHEGRRIQPDAVRIEECINYFDYGYAAPSGDSPFAVSSLLATCPWAEDHLLARVAIKGREIAANARPASNLVFLIDVSGSMQSPDKLPLLKRSMRVLIDGLDERDRLAMVVYASSEGVVLPPTTMDEIGKSKAIAALAKLEAGGSTNGGAGVKRAYKMALDHMIEEGVNRVILATDGDFNVGVTGQGELVTMIKAQAAKGVSLSVLGFGGGNLNDAMMEAVTNHGNGNYFYIDGDREAKRVFLQKLSGTLVTIAKDVKIQIEFNPAKVKGYRLIGYANRVLKNRDFNDDKVDAGDIGAGHSVTAFYEIVPIGVAMLEMGELDSLRYQRSAVSKNLVESDDWLTLKLRYKHPKGDKSRLIEIPLNDEPVAWEQAGNDFRMSSAVALFGMKLRQMPDTDNLSWKQIEEVAKPALADDLEEQRAEFIELLKELEKQER